MIYYSINALFLNTFAYRQDGIDILKNLITK